MNKSILVYIKTNKNPFFIIKEENTSISTLELVYYNIRNFYSRIYGKKSISIKRNANDFTITTPDHVIPITWTWLTSF